jgi:acetyl-CoA carboxylase biotin carboxyl carrier protein
MDLKDIKRLVSLVEEARISHLAIEENGVKIEIRKDLSAGVAAPQYIAGPMHHAAPTPVAAAVHPTISDVAVAKPAIDPNLLDVKAQMVGTFYSASSPDAAPFIKVGDRVKKGQVICIIEAMKLFNEIESDHEGVVEEITLKNGDAVEYGQVLVRLRP